MQRLICVALAFWVVACTTACTTDTNPPLQASGLVVNKPLPGMQMSAGYLELTNNSDETITITGVASPDFETVEIHETLIDDGISRMRRITELAITPGETVSLRPGGKHLMLMRPRDLADTVTLQFFAGDSLMLSVSANPAAMQ